MKVILVAATSVDGFIAQNVDQSSLDWTSKEDAKFFADISKKAGVLIMGSKTFETIGRPLPDRQTIVLTRSKNYSQFDSNKVRSDSRSLQEILNELEHSGQEEVIIAGGSSVYTKSMQEKVVDELYLTIEPIVFGSGLKLFNEPLNQKLELLEIIDLSSQAKVFHYKVIQ